MKVIDELHYLDGENIDYEGMTEHQLRSIDLWASKLQVGKHIPVNLWELYIDRVKLIGDVLEFEAGEDSCLAAAVNTGLVVYRLMGRKRIPTYIEDGVEFEDEAYKRMEVAVHNAAEVRVRELIRTRKAAGQSDRDADRRKNLGGSRARGEAALESLLEAKKWAGFHGAVLDPDGRGLQHINEKIADVQKYLGMAEANWPSKIDGLWFQAEQVAARFLP